MNTLFIANRGEIARRIAYTATRLGIVPVVPRLVGPGAVDLLDPHAVVDAARASRADAIHPGYGFLAESPEMAAAAVAAGLTWVGPPPDAIRALGDKAEARSVARRVDIPVADGEQPADQSDASLAAAAVRIGFPVVIKPVAGGGGKGIRVVESAVGLTPALAAARREAGRAFADERLLVERYLARARHVEVQVLGDAHGSVVQLGDRDCSLQRRHQKILEEAPAPGLDPGVRRSLRAAAVRMAAAVGYVNAGTCEFLVGADGRFVFLEMNARLQVEHPVTELVLGRDLVADQLAIADGVTLAALGLEQAAIEASLEAGGHAVEVRLNAEDPGRGFLPSGGRVVAIRWPTGASFGAAGASGIRVDAGIDTGDDVGGGFDPLLAKVIANGPDRAAAIARLGAALDETELLGLPTNLAFLRRLVRLPVVLDGLARIDTIESDPAAVSAARGTGEQEPPGVAWEAAARLLVDPAPAAVGPAGAWGGGWRGNARPRLRLVTDGTAGPLERVAEPGPAPGPRSGLAVRDGDIAHVSVDGLAVAFRLAPPPDLTDAGARLGRAVRGVEGDAAVAGDVRSPMPGVVVALHARDGAVLAAGDRIVTIEAMKMEHVVTAPAASRLEELRVREGEQVTRGQVLARLGADGGGR